MLIFSDEYLLNDKTFDLYRWVSVREKTQVCRPAAKQDAMKILEKNVLEFVMRLASCHQWYFELEYQRPEVSHVWSRLNLLVKTQREEGRDGFQSRIKNLKMLRRLLIKKKNISKLGLFD